MDNLREVALLAGVLALAMPFTVQAKMGSGRVVAAECGC